MKHLFILCSCFILIPGLLNAQTKKIAYKSHSGNMGHFKEAFDGNVSDMEFSNFGLSPQKIIFARTLDSVIFLSETKAIMVTSIFKSHEDKNDTVFWKSVRDTVTADPLFSKQHALDSIKTVMKDEYRFPNATRHVIFVGYDNAKSDPVKLNLEKAGKQKPVKKLLLPPFSNNNRQPPFDINLLILLATAALSAGLTGMVWKYQRL